jgi:polyhydroxybutyrate depolymerase
MKNKIIGIFVCMLLMTTCVVPVMGELIILKNEEKHTQKNITDINPIPSSDTQLKFMIAGKALRVLRTYWLHVPPSYDGSKAVPLVIGLNGYFHIKEEYYQNKSGFYWFFHQSYFENYTDFSTKADEEGFIVVYPNGKFLLPFRGWDYNFAWVPPIPLMCFKFVDDVGFLHDLIDQMKQDYKINESRIYITGFSDGASMTYSAGAHLSDIVAAIAPASGLIGGKLRKNDTWSNIPTPENPVSVIAFHGTDDIGIPYYGDWGAASVNESIAFWVEHNGCNPTPEINTSESGKIIRRTYTNGENGTEVTLYTTVGGNHWWPGTHYNYVPGSVNIDTIQEISATDLIWEFFEAHPKL